MQKSLNWGRDAPRRCARATSLGNKECRTLRDDDDTSKTIGQTGLTITRTRKATDNPTWKAQRYNYKPSEDVHVDVLELGVGWSCFSKSSSVLSLVVSLSYCILSCYLAGLLVRNRDLKVAISNLNFTENFKVLGN